MDLSGLNPFGKVNGVSGSNSNADKLQTSVGSGNSGMGGGSKSWSDVASDLGGLKVSDKHGNDLSAGAKLSEDTLKITAAENNVLVSGTQNDVQDLQAQGVKQISLDTNNVSVSLGSAFLEKATGTGGSFRLSTDDTTVNLTATDQNNKKTLDMTLTANKLSDTQAAPGQSSKQPVAVSIDSQSNTGNNSEGSTLQVTTTAPDATLTYSEKCAQALLNSEFRNLALAVGNLIATVDGMLAANTTVNGIGSISIGDKTVNMNGFEFSAGDSSENNKLADKVNNIKYKMWNQPQGDSAMVVEVNAKASLQSASLEVPGSALQSLLKQDVEETALTLGDSTTIGFSNSDVREKRNTTFGSKLDSASVILENNRGQKHDGVYNDRICTNTGVSSDEKGNAATVDMSDCVTVRANVFGNYAVVY